MAQDNASANMTEGGPTGDIGQSVRERLLGTLQRLLAIEATTPTEALEQAADLVAEALGTDKVDAFLYDVERDRLVAIGVSDTPMGRREREIGMDVLPLDGDERIVAVFRTGRPYLTGRAERDPEVSNGFTEGLGIRSMMAVALHVDGARRGVLAVDAAEPEAFTADDLRFLEAVAHWVGLVVQRAELTERVAREAVDRARAEGAVRVRDDFISTTTHDLRSPLTSMLGRMQLMRRRLAGGQAVDPQWLGRQLDVAEASARQMLATVDELSDVARLQIGQTLELEREAVDLGLLVQGVVEEAVVGGASPRTAVAVTPVPVVIEGDSGRLRRVLRNIVDNAVKYSAPGAPIEVRVGRGENTATVTVEDHGVGIPAADMPGIFTRYYRASTARGVAGSGLGLMGAKAIVEQHGGAITIDSAVGQGTTVALTFPLIPLP